MFVIQQPDMDSGEQKPPLERLEAQICELAGHLAAATCRFLMLLADFDARRGWATWDMTSCAQWLSWKCQMTAGTAREHVRVARALPMLPMIRGEFAAGRMSYAKVRALTRIATPETEAGLTEVTAAMTASQVERFVRAHRRVTHADDVMDRVRRRLAWRQEEDGTLSGTFRLPPSQGAVLLQALRAAAGDLSHPHASDAEQDADPTSGSLADALVAIAEAFLAGKIATADNPDVYQVIVHVSADMLTSGAAAPGVSAETAPGPAGPGRCHVEDGPAISITTLDMLSCEATMSWILHDHDGTLLDVGRRSRRPTPAIRRAARERDGYRCRFPGCESRRTDLHHIRYWRNGGRTELKNLVSLCRAHHRLVHDRDYLIAAGPAGTFSFWTTDGNPIPAAPALPASDARIEACHDADITFATIVPAWYGERLDLDYAIATCFANAGNSTAHAASGQAPEPEWRPHIDYLQWAS